MATLIIGLAAKPKMKNQESTIEFPSPEGFTPPDNAKEGDTFEVLATVRMQANNVLCLEAVDGVPVKHDEAAEAIEELEESPEEQAREDAMSLGEEPEKAMPSEEESSESEDGDFLKAVMGGLKKKGMGK